MSYLSKTAVATLRTISIYTFVALFQVSPANIAAEPFSLLCMPDPQYYTSNNPSKYKLYNRQSQWIVDNKTAENIKHVIWLGDLTNNNTSSQWTIADTAYKILEQANIPYAVVPGNHDYKPTSSNWTGANFRDLTRYNNTVGPTRFNTKSWYGGNMGNTTTNNENNYTYFSAEGLNFLVIGLEYAPRKEVLTWANNLISQHPNHRVILFTHGYLTTNGNYGGQAGSAVGTVGASGRDIFNECANRHSNVFMVVCGHVTESVVNTKSGVAGNTLYEMLVDYQSEQPLNTGGSLGNGWLRIMKFDPAANTIYGSTVTPAVGDTDIFTGGIPRFYQSVYNTLPSASDHLFTLNYNMTAPMEPYTYLNASLGFHAMSVNNDLHGDQLDPDIAQDDNSNWVSVWEDDSDNNGIYQIQARGFDSDGNVRINKSTVNTVSVNAVTAVNPAVAMTANGRYVVVWQSGDTAIKARCYNANGSAATPERTIVTVSATNATVANPDVAIDDSGNFVVTWADDSDGDGTHRILAAGFNFNGIPRFAAKPVNTMLLGKQRNPVIAMNGTGRYVIAWEDDKNGTWDMNMRGFNADETQAFAQTGVNGVTAGDQASPDIAMDDQGRFVVVWEDDADGNTVYQIKARGFLPTGAQMFAEMTVNVESSGNQINPAVDMDAAGNWYAVWEDNRLSSGYQMVANAFGVTGIRLNAADTQINPVRTVSSKFGPETRKQPVISAHKSGRYIVSWADDMDGDGAFQALARGMDGAAKSLVTKSHYGTVSKSPEQPFYEPNAQVTLTATPIPGYAFTGWSGDVPNGSSTTNPLNITMNTSRNITANFAETSSVGNWSLY